MKLDFVESIHLLCPTDKSYGVKIKNRYLKDVINKIMEKCSNIKEDKIILRGEFHGVKIVFFTTTGTLLLLSLKDSGKDVKEILEELLK